MIARAVFSILNAGGRDIKLTTDYGFNAFFLCCIDKIGNAEHIAMIRDGNSWHIIIFSLFNQVTNTGGPVEHTELCVAMQMRKTIHEKLKCDGKVTPSGSKFTGLEMTVGERIKIR